MLIPCSLYNSSFSWNSVNNNCNGRILVTVKNKVCVINAYDVLTKKRVNYFVNNSIADGCLGSESIVIPENNLSSVDINPTFNYTANDYQFVFMSFIILAVFFIVGYLVVK